MIVKLENISKHYKKTNFTLNKINLELGKSEILGVIGPDGAGKSTLLKIIANITDFDDGNLIVLGNNISPKKNYDHLKDKIAYMPQGLGLNLYQRLSVEENINFFANLKGLDTKEIEDRKNKLLEITGLSKFKDRKAINLSGGMKQKLGICCSLIHKPELIILDEPTIGVDPISRRELWDLFMEFVNIENLSIIISTSYMDEAERCDKVLFLLDGNTNFYGKIDNSLFEKVYVYEDNLQNLKNIDHYYKQYKGCRLKRGKIRFVYFNKINKKLKEPYFEDVIMSKLNTKYLNIYFKPLDIDVPYDNIIELKGISKAFGEFYALKNITFDVKKGEIFGLLGPNGAGKTTLLKILTGLYKQSEGSFKILGKESIKNLKKQIGYMSQKFSLYSDLTVKENIEYYSKIYDVKNLHLFEEIINTIGLNTYLNHLVKDLPLGFKQRLALICSIIHLPPIVFLDEPTSGVDPVERDVFWQLIFKLAESGITLIVTTHYMSEAENCDRVALISNGQLVAVDNPTNLKNKLIHDAGSVYEITDKNYFDIYSNLKVNGYNVSLYGRKIRVFSKTESFKHLLPKSSIVKGSEPYMEDVFVYYTK
ncbi:multidrug ABC transporter, ATP-binding protein [Deferribacter desulfuricans SSM1]|uniref:Multidrug ABC transporter, ATP-binding protein n=1 Tax=Deferribacter desulfuricans (strain DSM 14783 / JCM 11476 / NBRC 101012 / SSM1) TaxID=639282 RepID=D3P8K6_DEFDS|nr:ATP-binding cassette domain-containing protein [Deferribacter desulfuricans]BAI81046.1 multidrug ABC transporter, ATP-binding protein [Deferribacter desulfuricans SSM1]